MKKKVIFESNATTSSQGASPHITRQLTAFLDDTFLMNYFIESFDRLEEVTKEERIKAVMRVRKRLKDKDRVAAICQEYYLKQSNLPHFHWLENGNIIASYKLIIIEFSRDWTIVRSAAYNRSAYSDTLIHEIRLIGKEEQNRIITAEGEYISGKPVYVRFRKPRKNGLSLNHKTGEFEEGTSVYPAFLTARNKLIIPEVEPALISPFHNPVLCQVEGTLVSSLGSDGEKLIANPTVIKKHLIYSVVIPRFKCSLETLYY